MNLTRGNQNSLTLLQQGKNLRENLQFIGSKIAENQLLDAKEKVLEKYKDPVSVFSKQDGSMKSPFEVSQETFPDFMWLQSHGFEKEAKGLEQMFTAYNADIDQKAKNSSFLSLLSAEEKKKVAKMNFDRTDVADVYSKWKTMEYNTTPKPEKRTKPFAVKFGNDLYWMHQDDKGEWQKEVIDVLTDEEQIRKTLNLTPDVEPIYEGDDIVDYGDKKTKKLKPGQKWGGDYNVQHDNWFEQWKFSNPPKKQKQSRRYNSDM